MKFNKDDIYSIAGSVAFHLAIFLILLFTVLRTEIPEEDGGVLVNFGNVNSAAGTFEPKYTGQELPQETTTPPPPPTPPVETPKEEVITQDIEESVAMADAKKKEEQKKKEEERKRKEEEDRRKREEAEKKRLEEERRKRNRPSATALPEHSVSVVQKATARAMQKPEQVTRVVRSVTPTTEQTKA